MKDPKATSPHGTLRLTSEGLAWFTVAVLWAVLGILGSETAKRKAHRMLRRSEGFERRAGPKED